MFEKLELMQMAQASATHATLRQRTVSQNIANADTPGYSARDVAAFSDVFRTEAAEPMRATRAGHIGADGRVDVDAGLRRDPGTTSPNGNSVSLEEEMVKAVDVKRQHDLALTVYKTSLSILRSSLGGNA